MTTPPARAPDRAPNRDPVEIEAPPPFLGRWSNVYLLVLGELAATVALFALLSWWAA